MKIKVFSLLVVFILWVSLVLLTSSCSSLLPKGDKGETGATGPTGEAGATATLIKTYAGSLTSSNKTIDVPEILGKEDTTFVLVYQSYSSTPTMWHPVTDGWLDSFPSACYYVISWEYGKVYLNSWTIGDNYMIKVYQNS